MSTPDLGAIRARWDCHSAPSLHKKVWAHRGWPTVSHDAIADQAKEDTAALCNRVEQLEAVLRPVAREGCCRLRRGNIMVKTEPCGRCASCTARAALAADPPTEEETP